MLNVLLVAGTGYAPEQVDREDSLINDILTSKKAPEKR